MDKFIDNRVYYIIKQYEDDEEYILHIMDDWVNAFQFTMVHIDWDNDLKCFMADSAIYWFNENYVISIKAKFLTKEKHKKLCKKIKKH